MHSSNSINYVSMRAAKKVDFPTQKQVPELRHDRDTQEETRPQGWFCGLFASQTGP